MTPPFISLTRVRALGVVLAWHEAIAIAQRCAEQIPPTGGRAGLDTCAISLIGTVRVGGVSAEPFTQDALLALATALVDTPTAPPQLVAALSRAGVADSLTREDLMRELAFFSRPDTATAIAAVAARALAKEAESTTQDEIERLRAEAIAAPPKAMPVPRTMPKRRVVMAAGGLGVIMAAGALVWTMPWPSAPVLAESSPLTTVTTTLDRLLDRGLQSLGVAATETPATESVAPAAASSRSLPNTRRRVSDATAMVAPRALIETDTPGISSQGPLLDAGAPVETSVDVETPHRIDTGVYSRQDPDVEPPALAHPQLPSSLSTADRTAGSYLEVLVSETGTVERVRLESTRSTFHERMLVSAVKAWRFRPAVRDGVPVKYITLIAVPR